MSSKIVKENIANIEQEFEFIEKFLDISCLIIPFSDAFDNYKPPDIYNREELVPFEERDSTFKEILINEFIIDRDHLI